MSNVTDAIYTALFSVIFIMFMCAVVLGVCGVVPVVFELLGVGV